MKKIRGVIGLLLVGIILFTNVTFYQTGTFHLKGKKMYSQSAILVDETGKTIASQQKNKKIVPASLAMIVCNKNPSLKSEGFFYPLFY
ncbi:hypothetical protein [Vagococcus lutrae]|uniref:hypothetical protein n=1 Tax=Vagococcus lutrae TaxID=81947 RepID=UPI0023A9B43E|nr:hypothetical protein [Vagococcus lutrae]WEB81520.1 hypothetical protein LVJ09_00625 [Vagococcus lutrae]